MNITSIGMEGVKFLYKTLGNDKKGKERFEMILEPFQSIIQLALLSFCPNGSKLSIANNLLYIQTPTWTQSISRTYNQDKRDDLIFLFSVINRFHKFYSFLLENEETRELYYLLITLCKRGIDKISQTYSNTLNGALFQTLKIYKILLENKNNIRINRTDVHSENDQLSEENLRNHEFKNEAYDSDEETKSVKSMQSNIISEIYQSQSMSEDNDIDRIFIKIHELYEPAHFKILYHILQLLENSPQEYETYTKSINYVFKPLNNKIQEWITTKIIF